MHDITSYHIINPLRRTYLFTPLLRAFKQVLISINLFNIFFIFFIKLIATFTKKLNPIIRIKIMTSTYHNPTITTHIFR